MKTKLALVLPLAALSLALPGCGDLQSVADFDLDSVAYAPDGTLVAFTNSGIFLFDSERLERPKKRIPLDGLPSGLGPAHRLEYQHSLSPDGTVAAVSYSPVDLVNTTIALYRIPTGERLATLEAATRPNPVNLMFWLAVSPHGERVAIIEADSYELTVMDVATGTELWTLPGRKYSPVWSPEGGTVYVWDFSDSMNELVEAYDAVGGLKWNQPAGADVDGLAVMADGNLAGVAFDQFDVNCPSCFTLYPFWSAADGTKLSQLPAEAGLRTTSNVIDLGTVFTCSGTDNVCAVQLSAVNALTGQLTYWLRIYRPDGTVVAMLPLDSPGSSAALSPDGQFVALAGAVNTDVITVIRISDGTVVGRHSFVAEVL